MCLNHNFIRVVVEGLKSEEEEEEGIIKSLKSIKITLPKYFPT